MRRVLLLPTALLLAGCGAAGPSRGPASAPVLPDAPAPPIAAAAAPAPDWVLGLLHLAANAGVSSTEGWSCFVRAVPAGSTVPATQQCGPPTPAQKAEVEAQRKAHEAAMQPVAGSEPRVVATLRLANGGTVSFAAWTAAGGKPCWVTEIEVGTSGGGGGPDGPCMREPAPAGAAAVPCDALCLDSSGTGVDRTTYVLAGTVPASAAALRVTLADGSVATYPLAGPPLPGFADRRIFLLGLGASDWRKLELAAGGTVTSTVEMPREQAAFEDCGAKVGRPQPAAGSDLQAAMQPYQDALNSCLQAAGAFGQASAGGSSTQARPTTTP